MTQEVFLKVYRSLKSFEGRSSFKTWIYKIASNSCITYAAKKKKEKEGFLQGILDWWTKKQTAETPEEQAINIENKTETKKIVSEKIASLPEKYRMPVILKDIDGVSLEKIAEIQGIPLGTVKSRINRGRRILQESLGAFRNGRVV
jgi:RNA polymerase sigma-70 factor (ECF subfamily)